MRFLVLSLALSFGVASLGCEVGGDTITLPPLDAAATDESTPFACLDETSTRCVANRHLSCKRYEEFLEIVEVDCSAEGKVCHPDFVCRVCAPGSERCNPCDPGDRACDPNVRQRCDDEGNGWQDLERCELEAGDACFDGSCQSMCARARLERSYVGCEFYAVDLDNAAIDDRNNAAAQQYAVAVANPHDVPVDVTVELNDAPFGEAPAPRRVAEVTVPPGSLEIFELPRREVDGSSDDGLNDGTHSALSSNAYRVASTHPLTAYQFNPLENVDVFSNDASLLLPTSALGREYTVIAWPQTIGHSENPADDFDSTSDREDLRAFLTVVGTEPDTRVTITLGPSATSIVPLRGSRRLGPGDEVTLSIGPYDVVNLETEGLNVDFTGSRVDASAPVSVFVGSEASDVPRFGTYATRQCCADHLEEQLFPDSTAGTFFSIARMPARTRALAAAAAEGHVIDIAIVDEPEWVRVIALAPGRTSLTTTLPQPDDLLELEQGEDVILRADQDFLLESDRPVAVLQALASQGVTGIPRNYPGGDPSIIAVPPVQQHRSDYIFLTPDKYAFDFVVITAEASATVLLDGEPVTERCDTAPADGIARRAGEDPPDRVVYRCQLSFPEITSGPETQTRPGDQNDGVHTVVSNREVGIVVYGFDRFVSYAYVGGLDLDILQ